MFSFRRKFKPPPRYDEFMDLVTEQGFEAAVKEVQAWLDKDPEHPAYLRYLCTAYDRLSLSNERNHSAARYFLAINASSSNKKQRTLRVESDREWLKQLVQTKQQFDDSEHLFKEIAALCKDVNRSLYQQAMLRLVEIDELDVSTVLDLLEQATGTSNQHLALTCLKWLQRQDQIHLVDLAKQADILWHAGEYTQIIELVEPLRQAQTSKNNPEDTAALFSLANAYLHTNQLTKFAELIEFIASYLPDNDRVKRGLLATEFFRRTNAEMCSVSDLKQRLGTIPSHLFQGPNEKKVLFIDGNVTLEHDLAIDDSSSVFPNSTLGFDLVIAGNLHVKGSVYNHCGDTGCALIVGGNLEAEHLICGGSEVVVKGDTTLKGALIAHYNHGTVILHQSLTAKLVWNDDHNLNYGGKHKPESVFKIAYELDSGHQLIPFLVADIREKILGDLQRQYRKEIEDEGEDFIYPISYSEHILPEIQAGKSLSQILLDN